MSQKRAKRVKMRGSKTHGYGHKKKHRGSGSRGGVGYGGSFSQKRVFLRKYEPEHFEKKKFKSLRDRQFVSETRAINLRDLDLLIKQQNLKEVDLTALGFDKILGTGELTSKVVIKNAIVSARAKEKIVASGSTIKEEAA